MLSVCMTNSLELRGGREILQQAGENVSDVPRGQSD